jgi:hypothetical protein
VEPNEVLSNLVLRWMLESIKKEEDPTPPNHVVIPDINAEIKRVTDDMESEQRKMGDGDVYDHVLAYLPLIKPVVWLENHLNVGSAVERYLGLKAILDILLAVRDRRIPDVNARTYAYDQADNSLSDTVAHLAGTARYTPQTYETFKLYKEAAARRRTVLER